MNQEMNEKIRVIAEFDGWVSPKHLQHLFDKEGYPQTSIDDLKYLTSMAWLHPVAMKVLGELREIYDEKEVYTEPPRMSAIIDSCSFKPINGQYIDLFLAVVEGIKFIDVEKGK